MTFGDVAPARQGIEIQLEAVRNQLAAISTRNQGLYRTYLYNYAFRRAQNNNQIFQRLLAYIVQRYPLPP